MILSFNTDYHYEIGPTYDGKVPEEYRLQKNHTGIAYLSWYIRKGSVELTTADSTRHLHKGDWAFMDPFTTRSHHFSRDAELISIRFRLNWRGLHFIPPRLGLRTDHPKEDTALLKSAEALCAFEAIHRTKTHPSSPATLCRRSQYFSEWLYQWHKNREAMGVQATAPIDPRVSEIMAIIGQRPSIQPIDYAQLQTTIGLSKAQINRIFKSATGLTPRKWCEAQLLRAAEDWLLANQLSVKEIAARLDFFDASHFIKWFRAHTNVTPTVWRTRKTPL
ncbi:helix-turn-helix domain-containing protein [Coraliomargarita algicola]|uniref:Helix-turn-helix domain-containing protein n=1 Tax=Coraliomargarita algicola TaxID=3092156 RepID=A0ABZ0RSR9_9BACT|nr:helix-turn-helix domain-containing protein [Coraliomargarita sp. J2-16]WPJ98218.1 helix-turn-helix domain-containing protein [Coraliomargarita sp. J2-16]